MMAGAVLTVLPVLLLFLVLQRYYIAGADDGEREGVKRAVFLLLLLFAAPLAAQTRTLDDFTTLAGWTAAPSDGVGLAIAADQGALRLDFDFHGGAGYAVARKAFALDLPANWEISFRIRGEAPERAGEQSGVQADRSQRRERLVDQPPRTSSSPATGARCGSKKRQIEFAWGPVGGGEMKQVAALEIRRHRRHRRQGHRLDRRPDLHRAAAGAPVLRARPSSRPRRTARVIFDFLEPREYGGLVIDWEPRPRGRYAVEISDDGKALDGRSARSTGGNGGRDYLYLPETESRYLRLRRAPASPAELDVKPLDWAPSINAFFAQLAKDAPRGSYPRSFSGEQEYWTVVGVDGDVEEGLLGEDGALEVGQGAFSIEPFLFVDGELISWAASRPRSRWRRAISRSPP